jgi:proline iminopeptidase
VNETSSGSSSRPEYAVGHGEGEYIAGPSGQIYVEVEGRGPVVLLVGGGPGVSHVHYHPWFSRLAGRHTVVYYDHPGTGRSGPRTATTYTLEAYAAAIESIREYLDASTLALVGISFGGLPALEYLRARPRRVRRLALSNAAYSAASWQRGNIDNVNHEIVTRYPALWDRLTDLRGRGVSSLATEYQEIVGRVLPELEWARPDAHPALARPSDPIESYNPDAYAAFLGDDPEWTVAGSLAGFDPTPALSDFAGPTLILAGRHDRVTPVVLASELHRSFPAGTARLVVFERSAHRPWAEEPDRYFAELADFLR